MYMGSVEALRSPPECRGVDQIMDPKRLNLHLERRRTAIMCPRYQTDNSRVLESCSQCMGGLPILERLFLLWLHLRRFAGQSCSLTRRKDRGPGA
jgi:hypothetical protein